MIWCHVVLPIIPPYGFALHLGPSQRCRPVHQSNLFWILFHTKELDLDVWSNELHNTLVQVHANPRDVAAFHWRNCFALLTFLTFFVLANVRLPRRSSWELLWWGPQWILLFGDQEMVALNELLEGLGKPQDHELTRGGRSLVMNLVLDQSEPFIWRTLFCIKGCDILSPFIFKNCIFLF